MLSKLARSPQTCLILEWYTLGSSTTLYTTTLFSGLITRRSLLSWGMSNTRVFGYYETFYHARPRWDWDCLTCQSVAIQRSRDPLEPHWSRSRTPNGAEYRPIRLPATRAHPTYLISVPAPRPRRSRDPSRHPSVPRDVPITTPALRRNDQRRSRCPATPR